MDKKLRDSLQRFNSTLDKKCSILSIILAAGHGKRIKSERSKMLHTIWGKPSVTRVCEAVQQGLDKHNQIIVVGNKARQVIETVGRQDNTIYAVQEEQNGTGHATQIALESLNRSFTQSLETIFVFPADMGLISAEAVRKTKEDFFNSDLDMIIMTGTYNGVPEENYYGRIVRVPNTDINGTPSSRAGDVIEIIEFKDILSLDPHTPYRVDHHGQTYQFTRQELLEIPEFNAGVYGFKANALFDNINKIEADNIQQEFYLTDLVSILNHNGHKIGISRAEDDAAILGFNIKSVLKAMESIARNRVYEKLKDIITIEDNEYFFIDDAVVERILELDKKGQAVDIVIGAGVYLGKSVHIKKGVIIEKNTHIDGTVFIDEYTHIGSACSMDNYPGQKITIGRHCQLLTGTVIRGEVTIGDNVNIESGVRITGNSEYPVSIEENVLIKGTTYIFGSYIEKDVEIEHSILKQKRVERIEKKDGSIQAIRYCLPLPEGLDSLSSL